MAQLPFLGRTTRTTLVSITSLRHLHRLVACTLVVSLASLILQLWGMQ